MRGEEKGGKRSESRKETRGMEVRGEEKRREQNFKTGKGKGKEHCVSRRKRRRKV